MTKENDFTLQELELIATQMPLISKNSDLMQKIEAKIRDMQPNTIRIGGFDVTEPLREVPSDGTKVFSPHLVNDEGYFAFTWAFDYVDVRILQRGLVHTTAEAAILHTKALISLTETK